MKFNKKLFLFIMMVLLMVFALSGCGIIPKPPEGKISGRVLIPPYELSKDITGWVPAVNAVVTVVDANGITHTVMTDENGFYNFEDIAVNSNTVITASVTVDGNIVILKNVIPQAVTADEDYNAGEMTPESTALALVVEVLIAGGANQSGINLEEIESDDNFSDLVERITAVLEEGGDVTTDSDIADIVNNIVNPPAPPSPSTPSPTPKPDTTVTIAAIPGVTAPIVGDTPVTVITETAQYTGTVSWSPADTNFGYSTVYTANITLAPKTGYTFTGVSVDFFTVDRATATNAVNSVVVTAVFPETADETGPIYNQTQETYHTTIQKAINNSSINDIIVVSEGTYKENIVIDNKNITLKSTDPADSAVVASTIIDGQKQDSVVKILNGDTSTMEGFTIQNGNQDGNGSVYGGGGIFVSGSSPVIRFNIIGDNIDDDIDTGNTGDCGGGICVVDDSVEPHIYENTIIGNKGYYGGGMYLGYGSPLVEGNIIKENESDYDGGGILVAYSKYDGNSYCPIIKGNIIEYNKTTNSYGGGIAVTEEGSATIENNQIKNNEASFGGGIYIAFSSDADISGNNTIENNKAKHDGGGIYIYSDGTISITANTINNNIANIASSTYSGGGIYVASGSPTIGGNSETDTSNFNTICGNSPDQVDPDDTYLNNYICDTCPCSES
jgi:parallel beta-helix repeat protein